jgi:hypothetical protein
LSKLLINFFNWRGYIRPDINYHIKFNNNKLLIWQSNPRENNIFEKFRRSGETDFKMATQKKKINSEHGRKLYFINLNRSEKNLIEIAKIINTFLLLHFYGHV